MRPAPGRWLATALGAEALIIGLVAVLAASAYSRTPGRPVRRSHLATALGIQNSTVRHLGAPDLTTTVLTLTLTGLAADAALARGPGAKPHRRLGSVAAMLAGAAAGAGLLQLSPTAVIAIAAVLVAAVAATFLTAGRVPARGAPPAPARVPAAAGRT